MPETWWRQEIGPRIVTKIPGFGRIILVKVEVYQSWTNQSFESFAILDTQGNPTDMFIDQAKFDEIDELYTAEINAPKYIETPNRPKPTELPNISGVSEYTNTLRRLFP